MTARLPIDAAHRAATADAHPIGAVTGLQGALDDRGYNVKDYGATGDGVADDTDAIAACVAAAGGGSVYFPAGTYTTDQITITQSLDILLHPAATVKLNTGQTTPLLSVTGGTRLSVVGGTWDGNSCAGSADVAGLLHIAAPPDVTLDTRINGSGGDGLRVSGLTCGAIRAHITESTGHGLVVVDSSDVTVDVDVDGAGWCGVLVKPGTVDCERVTIRGTVRDVARTSATSIGVYFNSGDTYVVRHSLINVCVHNAGWVGIFPGGDYNICDACIVDGSGVVTATGGRGYWVHDSAHITLTGCISRRSENAGFLVNKAHAVMLTGCVSESNANAGFWLSRDDNAQGRYQIDDTNKDVALVGCVANNNSTAASNTYPGFYITGYKNVTFAGCEAHDYQDTQTQARGIVAATNVKTANISILGGNFTDNRSTIGILIDATYLGQCIYIDGQGAKAGFFATAPVLKPTVSGALGGNAALTSLCAALATLGLITNSTTA